MSEFMNTSYVIGDDALVDSIIMRTITEYREDRITSIGTYAFYGCTALEMVDVPNVTSIGANACYNCDSLETVNLPSATSIAAAAFQYSDMLTALILRGATQCSLANISALNNTPIASGTGYIYVPSALIDSYKAATNWSTYSAQFRALEDYTVDGTTTGELDETKI